MRQFTTTAALAWALAMSACGVSTSTNPGNLSVDDKGLCTQAFVDNYNEAIRSLRYASATETPSEESIQMAKKSCDKFKAVHANGVTCEARDLSSYTNTTASSSTVYRGCGLVDQMISRNSSKTPSIDVAPGGAIAVDIADCSPNFAKAVAKIETTARQARDSVTDENFQKTKKACGAFKRAFKKTYTCKTTDNNGTAGIVNANDYYSICEKINAALN